MVFVELKAPGGKIRPEQATKMTDLCQCGYNSWVIDSYKSFVEVMDEIRENGNK